MGIKLESKYIKERLRKTYGEFEVYNAIEGTEYKDLFDMIQSNTMQIKTETGLYDIVLNSTTKLLRYMLINLTNIESKEYWEKFNDTELEEMLNLADGDFKLVVEELMDILIEISDDVARFSKRQLNVLARKIENFTEALKYNKELEEKLEKIGITKELMEKASKGNTVVLDSIESKIEEAE